MDENENRPYVSLFTQQKWYFTSFYLISISDKHKFAILSNARKPPYLRSRRWRLRIMTVGCISLDYVNPK